MSGETQLSEATEQRGTGVSKANRTRGRARRGGTRTKSAERRRSVLEAVSAGRLGPSQGPQTQWRSAGELHSASLFCGQCPSWKSGPWFLGFPTQLLQRQESNLHSPG